MCLTDILIIFDGIESDHQKLVSIVLDKLDEEYVALKFYKKEVFNSEFSSLGHKISEIEDHRNRSKTKTKPTRSLEQLGSFMGTIDHLSKYTPNEASITDKFRQLQHEGTKSRN